MAEYILFRPASLSSPRAGVVQLRVTSEVEHLLLCSIGIVPAFYQPGLLMMERLPVRRLAASLSQ